MQERKRQTQTIYNFAYNIGKIIYIIIEISSLQTPLVGHKITCGVRNNIIQS